MATHDTVIVIGGGAAGMMAAGRAAECRSDVLLLEKTPRLGNKIRISGKGRCNVTNQADLADFVSHFGTTGPFLYGAFSRFFVGDPVSFLDERGVPTVVERGGRVFPVSDDARHVVAALEGYMMVGGAHVRLKAPVEGLLRDGNHITGVSVKGRDMLASSIVVATGGTSYPRTGSTGDGYRLAAEAGHRIVPVRPALVPLLTKEDWSHRLQGLSLQNVRASLYLDGSLIDEKSGEMLFTNFGVSGPIILTLSKRAVEALGRGRTSLSLDLKPALTSHDLDVCLQTELIEKGRSELRTVLSRFLPARLAEMVTVLLQIPSDKPAHQLTSSERRSIASLLKDLRLTVVGSRPIEEAIVTAGGVDTAEINPRTMESLLVEGLYFCGEVIDVDADTGGYNLQAAFSTGYVAGEAAAARAQKR